MSTKTIDLTPDLYAYLLKVSLRENTVLKKLREETHKLSQYVMQISPEQGQLMALLIELLGAKKTLDIGTFTGYSALAVALALPSNGKVVACDINVEWTNMAKQFWAMAGMAEKIELHLAPALTTLQKLIDHGEAETFDFAFIDADKNNYVHYYEAALTLLRPGGLVAIDNVLWSGEVANLANQDKDTNSIRALNEFIFKDERVSMSLVPIGDGLTLARKR
ncbi:MAG: class I SAM-dependent methyltransferase [Gammaproteobacteria bacterium]|nr:class I SAM-dependent methyltransferase [Gammaproteobacteria bacterium]MCW5582914.1 class I SAM-dependent methyltransferase [Gammaproteobacteria bacterium]